MIERFFWLSHAPLKVTCEDEAQMRSLAKVLSELRQEPAPDAQLFTIHIERDTGYVPPGEARLLHEGPLSAGVDAATQMLVAPDKEWLMAAPHGSVEADWAERRATVRLTDGGQGIVHGSLALFALGVALGTTDQLVLHGAGLRLPSSADVVLVFAPSGYGKTTAALAMALGGFALLTDDVLVLKASETPLLVWGLPRSMKVHRHTLALLPALRPVLGETWDVNGEQELTREGFAKVGPVAPVAEHRIAAVLLVDERTTGPHRIERLAKSEALIAVANDNLGRASLGTGVPRRHVRKMEGLAKLIAEAPAAKLHVGQPLQTLCAAVEAFVADTRGT